MKRQLGRAMQRWEDNIKLDLKGICCDDAELIQLAGDRGQWCASVNTLMRIFLNQLTNNQLLKKTLYHGGGYLPGSETDYTH